jgi:hypothetical protein
VLARRLCRSASHGAVRDESNGAARDDFAGIRLQLAEGDRRKCRLPRAVLADECVNLAGVEIEIDVVNRDDAREALADTAQ